MVNVFYDDTTPYVKISGDCFYDLLDIVHQHKLKWDGKTKKGFSGKAYKILNFLHDATSVDHFSINREIIERLQQDVDRDVETIFTNSVFDENLLEYKPKGQFQLSDIKTGVSQNRLAVFNIIGSGKSYIIDNIYKYYFSQEKVKRLLILSPQEGLYNFKRNLLKFCSSILTPEDIVIGSVKNRNPFENDPKVVIMTYRTWIMICEDTFKEKTGRKFVSKALAKKHNKSKLRDEEEGDSYKKIVTLSEWGDASNRMIVCDESHMLRNVKGKNYQWLKPHIDLFSYRYMLSATPTPNEYIELYPQIKLLDSMAIPDSYSDYKSRVCILGSNFSDYAIVGYKEDKVFEEQERLKKWVIRRSIEDCDGLELPELYIDKTYLEISAEQMAIYQALVIQELQVLKEQDGNISPKKVFQKFPYLSLALDDPILLKDKIDPNFNPTLFHMIQKWKFNESAKFQALESMVEEWVSEGRKVVVFDFHPVILDILAEYFKAYKPLVIHGGIHSPNSKMTDVEYRDQIAGTFRQDKDHPLLLASSMVVKTAIDLVEATRASYYSRNFSFLDWTQSMGRLHRIGQEERVIVKPLILDNTLNIMNDAIIERKANLDKAMFKNHLTLEQWQAIFNGNIQGLMDSIEFEEIGV